MLRPARQELKGSQDRQGRPLLGESLGKQEAGKSKHKVGVAGLQEGVWQGGIRRKEAHGR